MSRGGMFRKFRASRISLPFCIALLIILAILFRSLAIVKQSENELRLREEVQALSDEFGVEFSVTLRELVNRGIVSPTLANKLMANSATTTLPMLTQSEQSTPISQNMREAEVQEEEEDLEALLLGEQQERQRSPIPGDQVGMTSPFFRAHEWMRPGEKYFVYQSSGGLSNQRIMLESALIVGKLLNRTVVVPQLGPHTSMWYNFNNIALEDFVPADTVLDVDSMRALARVVFLKGDITFRQFIAENENSETWYRVMRNKLNEKRNNPWDMQYLIDHFGHIDNPVMIFARGTMWECFDFPPEVIDSARRAVRAHADLRKVARELSLELFPKGFNSLHIRFMDDDGSNLREGLLKPAASFIYRMKSFDKTLPLYIATVPRRRDTAYFKQFHFHFKNIMFGDVLERDERVVALIGSFTRKMRSTILGLIEQLVCARGEKFLGTGFSTFSEHIRRMRRWRELVVVEDLVDEEERARERQFASIDTPCWSPLSPC